jgi:hypothetical protein
MVFLISQNLARGFLVSKFFPVQILHESLLRECQIVHIQNIFPNNLAGVQRGEIYSTGPYWAGVLGVYLGV